MAWKSYVSEPLRRVLSTHAAAIFVISLATIASPPVLRAHVERLSVREIVAASPAIVIARVEGSRSLWNEPRTLILTDYTLRIEERLRGTLPDRVFVTVPGGTLGSVADDTCISLHLKPGARYLLFLDDLNHPTLTPVLGAEQGVFRELFREVPGIPAAAQATLVAPGSSSVPLSFKGRPIPFRDFVGAVRSLAARIPFAPRTGSLAAAALPAKAWDPAARPASAAGSLPPQAAPEAAIPPLPGAGAPGLVEITEAVSTAPRQVSLRSADKYLYHELAPRPVVVNPLTDSPFAPWDQYEMAYWNRYGGDLFRVADSPPPTWAYGNGVSDIVGFPDDTVMKRHFGYDWADLGGGVLAATFARSEEGVVVEADVLFNPHKSWTLDDLAATGLQDSAYSFKEIVLHELGHVWGLLHPWDEEEWVTWDSVMNYKFRPFHLGELYADDTTAVRRAFPSGVAIRDGLISSYVTVRDERSVNPGYRTALPNPAIVRAGGGFSLAGPIKIENVGTAPLVDPVVEVYLAPARLSFDGAVLVQRAKVRGKVPPGGTLQVKLKGLKIPRGAPGGTYSLAYLLRDPKDAYQGNNAAWSQDGVTVTVTR